MSLVKCYTCQSFEAFDFLSISVSWSSKVCILADIVASEASTSDLGRFCRPAIAQHGDVPCGSSPSCFQRAAPGSPGELTLSSAEELMHFLHLKLAVSSCACCYNDFWT